MSDAEQRLLRDLAHHLGGAVHARELREDLRHTRERLVLAREEERRRLRRDLHDGRGPTLARLARDLDVSLKTVQNHVSHVLDKLQAADRTQAALRARGL